MTVPIVRRAQLEDRDQIAEMMALLWSDASIDELRGEVDALVVSGVCGTLPAAIFVAESVSALAGFVQVGLRSHADGCDTSRPVGYIEGWFVREDCRRQGVGKQLVLAAEEWSRAQRCREIASDALIENQLSITAHESLGFEAGDRCVNFRKPL